MRIGLDLDNTLICYDGLFHRLALESYLIEPETPPRKNAVRDRVRELHGDLQWQELQAQGYGPRLPEAEFFPGARQALIRWRDAGHEIHIISHKSVTSGRGNFRLRDAALAFLEAHAIISLISGINFAVDQPQKVKLIRETNCRVMIDDLPEILRHPDFPPSVARVFFDPDGVRQPDLISCSNWAEIEAAVESLK